MQADNQLCTFTLDGLLFGVEATLVQEVLKYQEMTRVPLAPEAVRGLINLRGQIVLAIDLRCRLQLPRREGGKKPMNVVLHGDEGAVSFLVDEIGDVLEIDPARFERPPETLQGVARELIRGAYKLDDRLLLLLDAQRAMAVDGAPA